MNNKIFYLFAPLLTILLLWFGLHSVFFPRLDENQTKIEKPERSQYKVIAFGDSLTAGYGVSQAEAYPAQLQTALFREGFSVQVINAGVSGETTRGNLERASFIRSQEPDIIILGIGGNDALRALPFEETQKNFFAVIDVLRGGEDPPEVLLLQMQAPLNAGGAYKRQFDALYERAAQKNNLKLVPFITPKIFLDPRNKLSDGIHYNQAGYAKVLEEHLLPAVREVMKEIKP